MPKRVPPLDAKTLAAVRPSAKTVELIDGRVPGLRVRIHPSGKKTWSLSVRDNKGKRRRFGVGAGLTLAEARKKANDLYHEVSAGQDPIAERRARRQRAKAAREGFGTVAALLDGYFGKGPGSRLRTALASKKVLQAVFSDVLNQPALEITGTELQTIADEWRSPATSSLAIRLIRPCLKWSEKRGLVRTGIAAGLEQQAPVGRRERVLSRDELQAIWPHLKGAHGRVVNGCCGPAAASTRQRGCVGMR
jgi:hypothetical protein